jgi:hypothetical protein
MEKKCLIIFMLNGEKYLITLASVPRMETVVSRTPSVQNWIVESSINPVSFIPE